MTDEKIITINSIDVSMRYCAAAETGYEQLAHQSSDIFSPVIEEDEEGNKKITSKATTDDWIKLGMAAIIAAYSRNGQKPPITPAYIMYDAQPDEVRQIISTVIELRNQWYGIPSTIEATEFNEQNQSKRRKSKNAQPPTKTTSDS